MDLKPRNNGVLLKPIEVVEESKSGIFIPTSAKEKPQEGRVHAVGPNVTDIKKGDRVLYGKYAGTDVKVGGEEYVMLMQDDILAVIEE